MSSRPGQDDGVWFFPYGLDRETYGALDARDGVTSTSRAATPGDRELAESVVAAGRAAADGAWARTFTQKELWEVHAHIAGQVWLGVHLMDGGDGWSDEERAERQAYAVRLRDELRAIAQLAAHPVGDPDPTAT
ncbi:hypothetical protein ACH4E8_33135 [Streptomyces sp. NPDC017979]|uniref:hypothetical protein n=1 Tax=Streptomyces sp. NPDC017979 TaxID=3365024 RepID=UPI0037970664